jgi:hypothetical protein
MEWQWISHVSKAWWFIPFWPRSQNSRLYRLAVALRVIASWSPSIYSTSLDLRFLNWRKELVGITGLCMSNIGFKTTILFFFFLGKKSYANDNFVLWYLDQWSCLLQKIKILFRLQSVLNQALSRKRLWIITTLS